MKPTNHDASMTRNAGFRYQESLPASVRGTTVLTYLTEHYPHSSREEWRERIESGWVLLDGDTASASRELRPGQSLVWNRPPWIEPPAPTSIALLYRDSDLVAVAKPAGLQTMPGASFLEKTLLARVRRLDESAAPLHRLGRGTSGIVLCTLNRTARRALTRAWAERRIERRYRAWVQGGFPAGETLLDMPIGKVAHSVLGSVAGVSSAGKPAASRVSLVERRNDRSLVDVRLETGRTQQIRIHLAAAGYPLVGEPLYGREGRPSPDNHVLPGQIGYELHAYLLRFVHPRTEVPVEITCGPPVRFRGEAE
jgi:23S rRNA pseudouridine1911/1915/1917 synthase